MPTPWSQAEVIKGVSVIYFVKLAKQITLTSLIL